MDLIRILIRLLVSVALCLTPMAASAMPMHMDMAVNGHATALAEADTSHVECDKPVVASNDVSDQAPADNDKSDQHCGDCCLMTCAKHLTAICPCHIQIAPVRTTVKPWVPQAQLQSGLTTDPARKPPRI